MDELLHLFTHRILFTKGVGAPDPQVVGREGFDRSG